MAAVYQRMSEDHRDMFTLMRLKFCPASSGAKHTGTQHIVLHGAESCRICDDER